MSQGLIGNVSIDKICFEAEKVLRTLDLSNKFQTIRDIIIFDEYSDSKLQMKKEQPKIYAFIDSQNLNLGTSKDHLKNGRVVYRGWKLDFKKFRRYLSDKFRVDKAFLCIGYIKQNEKLYKQLKSYGYILIFKPTVRDNQGKSKGNVDAELVLHAAAVEFSKYDKAVIVSGDGDFYCLYEFLEKYKKLFKIIIPNRKSESSLLSKFQRYKIFLVRDREKVERK